MQGAVCLKITGQFSAFYHLFDVPFPPFYEPRKLNHSYIFTITSRDPSFHLIKIVFVSPHHIIFPHMPNMCGLRLIRFSFVLFTFLIKMVICCPFFPVYNMSQGPEEAYIATVDKYNQYELKLRNADHKYGFLCEYRMYACETIYFHSPLLYERVW